MILVCRNAPLSEVEARFSEIADEVDRTHYPVLVTKNGCAYVVLVSAEDLESLEATLELLADPKAQERVRQARADIDASGYVTGEEMAEIMGERRRREIGR